MPPVFGTIRFDFNQPDPAILTRMVETARYKIQRRFNHLEGPGYSLYTAGRNGTDSHSIYRKDNLVITADATLYNRKELRHRLKLNEAHPDASLILFAYQKWGSRCVDYLYGDFAFVIFNTESGNIFCGRDPIGIRPLFYSLDKAGFMFSSELRMIVAADKPSHPMRQEYLLNSLARVKEKKEDTPFENIFRLPPAHFMEVKKGIKMISLYWNPDPSMRIELEKESDYIDMMRELLEQAVRLRCEDASSIGAELSGGLDSSAICGFASGIAQEGSIPFATFSNVLPDDSGFDLNDEGDFIKEMAAFKSLRNISITGNEISIPELISYTVKVQGSYIQQNFNMLNYGLFNAAGNEGADVLLSGFGGDEVTSARIRFPWNEMIDAGEWKAAFGELFPGKISPKSLLRPFSVILRYLIAKCGIRKKNHSFIPSEIIDKQFARLPLNPEFPFKTEVEKRFRDSNVMPSLQTLAEKLLYRLQLEHLPQRIEYGYAAAAQFGIEYRYPLLDTRLILAFLAIPAKFKQHHDFNRYLFREAIRDVVPESIRLRNDKSGTTIPHAFYGILNEQENVRSIIEKAAGVPQLKEIFSFEKFRRWHEAILKNEKGDRSMLTKGLFYVYLQICEYYIRENEKEEKSISREYEAT